MEKPSLLKSFRFALIDFRKIIQVVVLPFWKVILYSLFLAAIMSLPFIFQVGQTATNLREDAEKIIQQLPNFTIQNEKLTPETSGKEKTEGIFMTNSLIVTFDPQNARKESDLKLDASPTTIALGFFSKRLVVVLPTNSMMDSLSQNGELSFSYKELGLEGFTKQDLSKIFQFRLPWWSYALLFALTLYPVLLNFLFDILFITLFATLFARFFRIHLRFMPAIKLVIFSSTWGVFLTTIFSFIQPAFNNMFLMTLLTMLVFYQALKGFVQSAPKL